MDKDLIAALQAFFEVLVKTFGASGVVWLAIVVVALLILWRIYTDIRKSREIDKALQAKDETIQILAEQNRQYRVLELKEKGLSDELIEQIVLQNKPKNPVEARLLMEKSKPQLPDKSS